MKKSVLSLAFTLSVFAFSLFAADKSSGADYPLGLFDFDFGRFGTDAASHVEGAQAIGFSGNGGGTMKGELCGL